MRLKNLSSVALLVLTMTALPALASIIKVPPAKTADIAYKDLVCSVQDRDYVTEVITTLGETSTPGLIFKQVRLKEIEVLISHLHPLKFLSIIFTQPHLKEHMNVIWGSSFKKSGFMDGLGPSLTREAEKGKLNQHINDFAKEIGAPAESLQGFFNLRDWEGAVFFLMQQ